MLCRTHASVGLRSRQCVGEGERACQPPLRWATATSCCPNIIAKTQDMELDSGKKLTPSLHTVTALQADVYRALCYVMLHILLKCPR